MITTGYDNENKVLKVAYDGTITANDYKENLIPAIEAEIAKDHAIRLVVDLSKLDKFSIGAMFEDSKLGFEYLKRFEKVSIISEPGIIFDMKPLFEKLLPSKVKFFKPDESKDAFKWAA